MQYTVVVALDEVLLFAALLKRLLSQVYQVFKRVIESNNNFFFLKDKLTSTVTFPDQKSKCRTQACFLKTQFYYQWETEMNNCYKGFLLIGIEMSILL